MFKINWSKYFQTRVWLNTFSGVEIDLYRPEPHQIRVEDIAHALSMTCRYNGHCSKFYSVAEHSYHLSYFCSNQLKALLHDSAEAYLSDVVYPLKTSPAFRLYKEMEAQYEAVIATAFSMDSLSDTEIAKNDRRIVVDEIEQLFPAENRNFYGIRDHSPLGVVIKGWSPSEAKSKFLERFAELTK